MLLEYPIFLDTEFSSWRDPELISIGLVGQSGRRELYAELMDFDIGACSDFVREAVLPLLQGGWFATSSENCRVRVKDFIESIDAEVIIVSDFPNYDWMLFKETMGEAWPNNLARSVYAFDPGSDSLPRSARNEACAARQRYYHLNRVPLHHALHDARALREAWIAALDCGWHPGAAVRM